MPPAQCRKTPRRPGVYAMTGDRIPMELRGMRAAVLGSTSGIGRAVALALADAGADVIVHGASPRVRVRKRSRTRSVPGALGRSY